MIPMVVRPHNGIDSAVVNFDAVVFEDPRDVLLDQDAPAEFTPFGVGREFLPVVADGEIEEYLFARRVLNEEAESWAEQVRVAFVVWLEERSHGKLEASRAERPVNDLTLHRFDEVFLDFTCQYMIPSRLRRTEECSGWVAAWAQRGILVP